MSIAVIMIVIIHGLGVVYNLKVLSEINVKIMRKKKKN